MKVANIIVYDLETGGFNTEKTGHKHGLCEIAMVAIDIETLEKVDQYETIIAPYKNLEGEEVQYTEGAERVHGLSIDQIRQGEQAKVVVKEIADFAKKHKKKGKNMKPILAGHNIVKFDNPFLNGFLNIFNKNIDDYFNELVIDTLLWTRLRYGLDGDILNHQLGTACEKNNIELVNAHSAMPDTQSNADLVIAYLKSLRNEGTITEQQSRTRADFAF